MEQQGEVKTFKSNRDLKAFWGGGDSKTHVIWNSRGQITNVERSKQG